MRILLFANTDWFLYNFKLSLARSLRDRGHEVVLVSPAGPYGPELRRLGFRWEPLELSRSGIDPIAELLVIRRLRALYRRLRPDVAHHFTIKCVIYGSFAGRAAAVPRIVNSVTGLGFALLARTIKARSIRPIVALLYRRALAGTTVIFQNHDNLATLNSLGALRRSETRVIPGDGIDTERFMPPAVAPAEPVVLMMGRLLWSKGVAEFVAAAALVRAEAPAARFVLAGAPDPGNPESVDEETLRRWRSEGHVELVGQRSDVLELQQACSIAVLASTQGEGMPRALLEAGACGKPMVGTDVPGSRELVEHGVTGLLVPPADSASLAAAILSLLRHPELALRMGWAARARVVAEFSDHRITARTEEVYGLAVQPPAAVATRLWPSPYATNPTTQ
jgi:glycosyltransferase involved in cell wall biosynthesis